MTTIRTLILVALALGLAAQAAAQDDEAQAIIDAMIDNLRADNISATIAMTVTRGDQVNEYLIETLSSGEDRSLIRVVP